MSAAYPATALLARDEIRLIRLLPGAWKDDIHCELVYDRLASVRPYQALSYVWGSSKRAKTISLDGQSFAVTVNLESTLRHLRSRTQDTLLWIDALCINQANDSERTHQVNLMGNIYRSSQGVLVYLGDGIGRHMSHIQRVLQPDAFQASDSLKDGESDRRMQETVDIFSFVRTLSWVNHLADIPWLASNTDNPGTDKALMYIFESLRRLMHAPFTPWWGRIWVVQEVILPPQVTVICGTVSAPWSIFARAASKGLHHLHHCCAKDLQHLPRDVLNVLQDFGERVTDIDHLRKTCLEELGHTKRSYPDSDIPELDPRHLSTEQRSLTALLRRFRGRKASDPRDKVYALLSLVEPSPHRPPLMPDYSLSSAEVYTLAALESIYSSASLTVLSVDNTRKYRQDLPSWVPDWEAPGDFSYNTRMDAMSMYEACAEYPVNPDTVRVRGRGLIIESLNVDVVAECGPVMLSDSSETFLETMVKWLFLKRGFTAVKETTNTDKVLWRVLCADVILSHPGIDDSGDLFRRMEDEDELLFVTWALTSRRSPFF
ncbi:HET-domain-containing protein, partial [Phaeosphaeriaceae sp. SRC1lsM3a]